MPREEDDESMERDVWTIECCPDEENCSKTRWKGHQPWSMESKERCYDYLAHHLFVSGRHLWSKQQIFEYLDDAEHDQSLKFTVTKDTFQMREEHRENVAVLQANLDKKRKGEPGSSSETKFQKCIIM